MPIDKQESITASSSPVTVEKFLEHGRQRLSLTLLTGPLGLGTEIPEPTPNRPGLALTGFFDHFAHKRLQVIGLAEYAYLQGLPEAVRISRFEALFSTKIPCVVFTRGLTVFPELLRLAEQAGVPVMQTPDETKIFAHNATFVLEELQAPCKKVHGTMLEVAGVGVFIECDPGVGKSETALGLIMRGHALVADDLTNFRRTSSGHIMAFASEVTRNYMEIRGVGILDVPAIFGVSAVRGEKQVDLVITLMHQKRELDDLDRTGIEEMTRDVLGVKIPQRIISVAPGRDLVNLVETAARQHKHRMQCGNAGEILDERIKRHHIRISNRGG